MGPLSLGGFQHLVNSGGCLLTVGDRVDHLATAIHAVSASEIMRIAGSHGLRVNNNATILQFEVGDLLQNFSLSLLAERFDHHLHIQSKLRSCHGDKAASAMLVLWTLLGAHALQGLDALLA